MTSYRVKCNVCGYIKSSRFKHTVCPKCNGSMHRRVEPSYFNALKRGDQTAVKRIEDKLNKGEIVKII